MEKNGRDWLMEGILKKRNREDYTGSAKPNLVLRKCLRCAPSAIKWIEHVPISRTDSLDSPQSVSECDTSETVRKAGAREKQDKV